MAADMRSGFDWMGCARHTRFAVLAAVALLGCRPVVASNQALLAEYDGSKYERDPPSYNCYIHEPDEPSECIDVPVSQLQTCLVAIAEAISGGTLAAAVRRCFEGGTMPCAPEASSPDAWPATDR